MTWRCCHRFDGHSIWGRFFPDDAVDYRRPVEVLKELGRGQARRWVSVRIDESVLVSHDSLGGERTETTATNLGWVLEFRG
jgi:hypothetical protein